MIFHSYLNGCLKYAKLLQERAANPVDSDNCEVVESNVLPGNYFCSLSHIGQESFPSHKSPA